MTLSVVSSENLRQPIGLLDLPGCVAAGDDLHETKVLMERAIELHLAGIREDGDPIPEPTTEAEYLEVPAA